MRPGECSSVAVGPSGGPGPGCGEADERIRVQQLYREHSSSLVRQLTRKTGCRELACDLVNESFLRLLRMAPGNLGRIEQPEAYLRRISVNLLRRWGKAEAFRAAAMPTPDLAVDPLVDQVAVLESRDTLRRLVFLTRRYCRHRLLLAESNRSPNTYAIYCS